jgi:hypothetical protein
MLGCSTPIQAGSVQLFAPPLLGRGEIFPHSIWPPVLSGVEGGEDGGGAICPPAARDYVVPSRDVWSLPGGVSVILGGIRLASGKLRQAAVQGSMSANYGGSTTS